MLIMKLKAHIVFVTGLLFVLAGELLGQGLCDRTGGGFTLNQSEGCAPLNVIWASTVQNPILIGYNISYDGRELNPPTQNITSYRYASAGEYTILQQGATGSGAFFHCEKIKVYESRVVTLASTACGGGKINLTFTSDVILNSYDRVEINWGDGTSVQYWTKGDDLNIEHTYSNTNSKPIIKVIGLYDNPQSACKQGLTGEVPVTFEQANLGNIQVTGLEMKSTGVISYSYIGLGGINTEVKYSSNNGNSFQVGVNSALGGPLTFPIQDLNPKSIYKVKLSSEDRCGGQVDSDIATSMVIEAKQESGKVEISWNKYDVTTGWDFTEYELYANGILLEKFSSVDDIKYTDTNVDCGYSFSYKVVAKLKKGNTSFSSTSSEVIVRVENDGTETITGASVSVNGDKVLISTEIPARTYTLNIDRAESGSTLFRRIMTLDNENEYLDSGINPSEKSYCYKFSYRACNIDYKPTEPICTILLKKDVSVLSWSPEQPFLDDLENYTVSQTSISGVNVETDRQQNLTFSPQFNNQSELEYAFLVKATSQNGNFESLSNTITYRRGAGVFVPTAFTPNDDIYNNTLFAVAEQVKSFDFTIMNRWGNVVFHTSNLAEGWDGKIDGVNAAVGSYVYKIVFVDDIDQKVEKRGTFMLLR
jgi:gliding motility-associated-like protein